MTRLLSIALLAALLTACASTVPVATPNRCGVASGPVYILAAAPGVSMVRQCAVHG